MKKNLTLLILFSGVFLIVVISYYFSLFSTLQNKFTDRLFLKRSPEARIVIVSIDDISLAQIGQWPWPRSTFTKILSQLDNAKAVGIDINFSESSRLGTNDDATLAKALNDSKTRVVLPIQMRSDGVVSVKPLDIFTINTEVGFVNVPVTSDNVVRQINNHIGDNKSFSAVLFGGNTPDSNRINYTGPAKNILTLSFIDVYKNQIPPSIFKDATVLIGATASDLHDFLDTPFGILPGVEVHANAIETLETVKMLNEISKSLAFLLILIIVGISGYTITLIKKLLYIIGALMIIFIGIIVISFVSFQYGIILPILYMLMAFILTSSVSIIYQYVSESKEKRFIQKTFQYYLMPEVINEIIKDPKKLSLGGQKKKLTILFSDIRGFTSFSEKLSPEELVRMMNEYFTLMSNNIMDHKGLVDKYIGDAIMAFWGAPVSNESQASDACMAALVMSASLKSLNTKWKELGVPEIGIGIGLNTGEVIVGNMGSEKRFNYTIMGDEVNFGSRLEGLNKTYGTQCIISEETWNAVKNDTRFIIRELDNVMVKGKKQPKLIFELITTSEIKELERILPLFSQGRMEYTKGNFKQAAGIFEQILKIYPDGPSQTFLNRCLYLIEHAPLKWNGIYEFETK